MLMWCATLHLLICYMLLWSFVALHFKSIRILLFLVLSSVQVLQVSIILVPLQNDLFVSYYLSVSPRPHRDQRIVHNLLMMRGRVLNSISHVHVNLILLRGHYGVGEFVFGVARVPLDEVDDPGEEDGGAFGKL